MPRPTIRSIAQAANVSNCTVSRALRSDPHLSERTRERIQKLAREMGYEVNAYVSSWMAHVRSTKTNMSFQGCIAYLNCHTTTLPLTAWDTPRRQIAGATVRANELGYHLEHIAVHRDSLSAERLQQILDTRAIKGILLPVSGAIVKPNIQFNSYACVAIGHHITDPPVHVTSADHHTIVLTACEELSKLGYQRIGFFHTESADQRLEKRPSSAYLGWQRHLPKARQIPPLLLEGPTIESELVAWCRKYKLDCVISFDDHTLRRIISNHFVVGKEIGYASLDWHGNPDTAGIDQQHEVIGTAAVDVLVHMLNNNAYGIPKTPRTTLVEGLWRPGPTAPPRC